ncbi:hypothetical protein QJS10_CPA06g00033 [Acorus calamus]|uniref:Endonuclease/exonuclease/phosphatase domain-containing protein n=1 Tax=Acorus calamus TaxID=4465 RepID=A0AAV9ELD9_ACOCL|nr:hypothetical protein QJS10_CPA06g00033 [Acorus calamus]
MMNRSPPRPCEPKQRVEDPLRMDPDCAWSWEYGWRNQSRRINLWEQSISPLGHVGPSMMLSLRCNGRGRLLRRCLCWNIRGLNDPCKRRAVYNTMVEHRIHMCCLQETKMEEVSEATVRETGGGFLDAHIYKGAVGTAGRMMIMWNSGKWRAIAKSGGRFSILVLLECRKSGWTWVCSCVYGPHDDQSREQLWDELSAVRAEWNYPWVILGDFNVTRYVGDRNRPGPISPGMTSFSSWIDEEGLLDIPLCNSSYTWSNMQEVPSMARLDRVLLNTD